MKLSLFIDKKDIEKNLTKDPIINIIGLKGSGKTTLSSKYINDNKYLVISTDRLYSMPTDEKDTKDLELVRKQLLDKYKEIPNNESFIDCYNDIVDYAIKSNKILIIEGNALNNISINQLKGKLIIKRTAVTKCFIRSIKRDYNNTYFMNLEKEQHPRIYKLTRLYKLAKRRSKIFKEKDIINKILKQD